MADEEVLTSPNSAVAKTEAESTATAKEKSSARSRKAVVSKTSAASSKPAKPKTRGLSDEEKLEKIRQIEAAVAGGATLKDSVRDVGISDQTYYQWKKAVTGLKAEDQAIAESTDEEFAEFIQLEEENRRLRKLLSEKLRAENAELRKRLGIR